MPISQGSAPKSPIASPLKAKHMYHHASHLFSKKNLRKTITSEKKNKEQLFVSTRVWPAWNPTSSSSPSWASIECFSLKEGRSRQIWKPSQTKKPRESPTLISKQSQHRKPNVLDQEWNLISCSYISDFQNRNSLLAVLQRCELRPPPLKQFQFLSR